MINSTTFRISKTELFFLAKSVLSLFCYFSCPCLCSTEEGKPLGRITSLDILTSYFNLETHSNCVQIRRSDGVNVTYLFILNENALKVLMSCTHSVLFSPFVCRFIQRLFPNTYFVVACFLSLELMVFFAVLIRMYNRKPAKYLDQQLLQHQNSQKSFIKMLFTELRKIGFWFVLRLSIFHGYSVSLVRCCFPFFSQAILLFLVLLPVHYIHDEHSKIGKFECIKICSLKYREK